MSEINKRSSKSAGDASEYYVAYMLSRLGISAALTTSGSSAVDIIATIDGSKSISIQVKGSWARSQPRQWMVGKKRPHASDTLFYVFCNISEDIMNPKNPEVFVVPSKDVDDLSSWHHQVPLFKISSDKEDLYSDKWTLIEKALR